MSKPNLEEALSSIEKGHAIGYIEFPTNYTNYVRNRGLYRNFVDNETLDGSALKMRMDLSGNLICLPTIVVFCQLNSM